jgi:hypothetical protein
MALRAVLGAISPTGAVHWSRQPNKNNLRRSPIAVIINRFAGDRQPFWVYGRDRLKALNSATDLAQQPWNCMLGTCVNMP